MSLAAFILALCEIWTTPSGPIYVRHMREAPGGAEARAMALSRTFSNAAVAVGGGTAVGTVSPRLLAAVAFRETGFDPERNGTIGERCIMQLNPRNAANRKAIAQGEPACVNRAADILARELIRCGTVSSALGAYASGRCNGAPAYSRRVLATLTGWP